MPLGPKRAPGRYEVEVSYGAPRIAISKSDVAAEVVDDRHFCQGKYAKVVMPLKIELAVTVGDGCLARDVIAYKEQEELQTFVSWICRIRLWRLPWVFYVANGELFPM